MRLLLATGNDKKRRELEALLRPLGVEIVSPKDVGGLPEVVEDADTFSGNARKKAVSAAEAAGEWSLADDSGLEVEALGGAPGVHSARYAGVEHGDAAARDAANNQKLLKELLDEPPERRRAGFVCTLALARPDGTIAGEFTGRCSGSILHAGRGSSGFGYDPLFLFDESGQPGSGSTFAELSGEEKAVVSHRGRALAQLAESFAEVTGLGATVE